MTLADLALIVLPVSLGLNAWALRGVYAELREVKRAMYGTGDAPGVLTRLALIEQEQRRQRTPSYTPATTAAPGLVR